MNIKGIIFDADGTLLDSMGIWKNLGERYLLNKGITPGKNLSEILYPMTLPESCAYLQGDYKISDSIEEIHTDLMTLLKSFYLEEVEIKSGVRTFLNQMREQNMPMMVASSNDVGILKGCFERLKISDFFCEMLSTSNLNLSKKDPHFYWNAARQLGTLPKETIVFEDALFAILAAKEAGMKTVAIADESNISDREALKKEADLFILDFTDKRLSI